MNIVSFSGGKDSTAMVHKLREDGVDFQAFWYMTPWEFPEMEKHVHQVEKNLSIKVHRIYQRRDWTEDLLPRWKWPAVGREWCTAEKRNACNKYIRQFENPVEYIGFSADEIPRSKRDGMVRGKKWPVRFPLIEKWITEKDALKYCYSLGYDWDGLYNWMPSKRISCFCCPKQGRKDIKAIRTNRPELWGKILEMDKTIENNGGYIGYKTACDLEREFAEEDKQEAKQGVLIYGNRECLGAVKKERK